MWDFYWEMVKPFRPPGALDLTRSQLLHTFPENMAKQPLRKNTPNWKLHLYMVEDNIYRVLQPMQIENPLRFTAYIDSDHQILYMWAHFFTQDIIQISEGQVMRVWDGSPSLLVWTSQRQQITFWGQLLGIPGWIEMPESSHLPFSLLSASTAEPAEWLWCKSRAIAKPPGPPRTHYQRELVPGSAV